MNILYDTVYWSIIISVILYILGKRLQDKFHLAIFNPLLFSTVFTVIFLVVFNIDYDAYYDKTECLYYLLTPATVCLAIPLYEQIKLLKDNFVAIIIGVVSGVIASLCSILIFSIIFKFSHEIYVTLLPKSITAAMGMGVSEKIGGIPSLTVPIIIITGITGSIIAETVCKFLRISEPIAKGVAIGSSSHAMGTSKAIEMGEVEGAMSGLSIAVAGAITVVGASIFAQFY